MARIAARNVGGYNEADVREEIVFPILDVLGYDRDAGSSIEREKRVRLVGSNRYLDYAMTPWSRNHWLIEAKSAKGRNQESLFTADEVEQAVGYSVHPDINAALVVLCDGWKIAVFDREEDLAGPALTVQVSDLVGRIDELRRSSVHGRLGCSRCADSFGMLTGSSIPSSTWDASRSSSSW